MTELYTRWDWICLGICIGVMLIKALDFGISRLDAKLQNNDMKLRTELLKSLVMMKENLEQEK